MNAIFAVACEAVLVLCLALLCGVNVARAEAVNLVGQVVSCGGDVCSSARRGGPLTGQTAGGLRGYVIARQRQSCAPQPVPRANLALNGC